MQICPNCQHQNPDDKDICEKCSSLLRESRTTIQLERDLVNKIINGYQSNTDLVGTQLHDTSITVTIHIKVKGKEKTLVLSPKDGIVFGREKSPMYKGLFITLNPFDAYQNGVSRSHARIALEEEKLNLYDLGSSNGTFLNGQRLTPRLPYRLHDGDTITFGKLETQLQLQ